MAAKNDIQCPYGDKDCPKVEDVKTSLTKIKYTLYAILLFILIKFGAEFLAVFK